MTNEVDRLTATYRGLELHVSAGRNDVHISKIVVPQHDRGTGVGTRVIGDLARMCDRHGWTLTVTPSSEFGTSQKDLDRFYRRLGFTPNSGRARDYAISATMLRRPENG